MKFFLLLQSLIASHAFRLTPIQTLYRQHKSSHNGRPGLDATQLRRALASAGSDKRPATVQRYMESYGDSSTNCMYLKGFDTLVRTHPELHGARFWLTVDPENVGWRTSRRGFAKFGRAGLKSPMVVLHYAFGLASLAVGTADMTYFLATLGTGAFPQDVALTHAGFHTVAAFFSLWRFQYDFKNNEWWKGGLSTSREANMWPSFVIASWYTFALMSDLVWPSASLSIANPTFWGAGVVTSSLVAYGVLRGYEEDKKKEDADHMQFKASLFSMAPVLTDTARALFFGQTNVAHFVYLDLLTSHPLFSTLQIHLILGAMYAGNLLCALASARLHKACNDENIATVALGLNVVYGFIPVLVAFYMDDGTFVRDYIRVLKTVLFGG